MNGTALLSVELQLSFDVVLITTKVIIALMFYVRPLFKLD